jgi:hypothetical protein
MSSSQLTLTPLRQRMLEDMRMRKLSDGTQRGYIRAVKRLAGRLAPPVLKTFGDSNCTWSTKAPRRTCSMRPLRG